MTVATKSDGSPVSSSDLSLDSKIRAFIETEFSGTQVISEEDVASHRLVNFLNVAVVDPLDGTENYVSGLPIWGVSVAIWQNGFHHSSMLAFPELGVSLVTGDKLELFDSRIVGHSSSTSLAVLAESNVAPENRILGSAAFNFYCVATGRFASFSNDVGANSWDILGGLNLAKEQGCEVTVDDNEYRGQFLDASRKYRFKVQR